MQQQSTAWDNILASMQNMFSLQTTDFYGAVRSLRIKFAAQDFADDGSDQDNADMADSYPTETEM